MKYLKYFETEAAYEAYKNGSEFVLPNVSFVVENTGVAFNPYVAPVPKAGDIVFIKDGILDFVDYND